jgi:hypothetical protein
MQLKYIAHDDLPRARAALAMIGSEVADYDDETVIQYVIVRGILSLESEAREREAMKSQKRGDA